MVRAEFKRQDCTEATAYGLTQWDYGQRLELCGLEVPEGAEVHFAATGSEEAAVCTVEVQDGAVTVPVPDDLLCAGADLRAYVYAKDGESGRTLKKIFLPVRTRPKPADYVYTPEERTQWQKLEALIGETDAQWKQENERLRGQVESLRNAADGLQTGVDGLRDDTERLRGDAEGLRNETENLQRGTEGLREDVDGLTGSVRELRDVMEEAREEAGNMWAAENVRQEFAGAPNLRGTCSIYRKAGLAVCHVYGTYTGSFAAWGSVLIGTAPVRPAEETVVHSVGNFALRIETDGSIYLWYAGNGGNSVTNYKMNMTAVYRLADA